MQEPRLNGGDSDSPELARWPGGKLSGGVTGKGWTKGVSGNPGGWPKGTPRVSQAVARLLSAKAGERFKPINKADLVARALFNKAVKGNVEAIKELLNRTEGRVKEVVEVIDESARAELAICLFIRRTGLERDEAVRWIEEAEAAALTDGK